MRKVAVVVLVDLEHVNLRLEAEDDHLDALRVKQLNEGLRGLKLRLVDAAVSS